ncbi:hypothetical protein ACFFUT_09215 [Pseudohalocynthiibacter aestuariivivens]|uniref:Uncharacterized protein n=1 Tax=Pseudohalocynthiibacter aestuariivivens TaxID=1591409 RepID=A0ABV5JGY0_9RHOB|nr:hypothetical protein [Pseudohalocynthiibacter aestuariivivens]MBS9718512.1 hypothetical protein [Pseudohalocynthiibacter aestuariivivens]
MSDGPHRSLPMRNYWKRLAERADKAAYSVYEVSEALPVALRQEFREAPVEQLKKALGADDQGALFSLQNPQELDALRTECPGSAAGNALIDCAKEAVASGLTGEEACERAVESALDECSRSAFRGIEEHYYREAPDHRAQFVRSRMDEARRQCDLNALAKTMLNTPPKGNLGRNLSKHDGLDEGPELR